MTYKNLQQLTVAFRPVFMLEEAVTHDARLRIKFFLNMALSVLLLLTFFAYSVAHVPQSIKLPPFFSILLSFSHKVYGLLFLVLFVWLLVFMLESFFYSYYFEGLDSIVDEDDKDTGATGTAKICYELADIVYHTGSDVTVGFLKSYYGGMIMARTGLADDALTAFFAQRKTPLTADVEITVEGIAKIEHLVRAIFAHDKEFEDILFHNGVKEEELMGATEWYERGMNEYKRKKRKWSRENLGRIPSLGRGFSYGRAYALEKYATPINEMSVYGTVDTASPRGEAETRALEGVLSRRKEANAVLIGPEGSGTMEIIARFAREISEGTILPTLEYKEVLVFDGDALIASTGEKMLFERELINVFNQSIKAGNIILVMTNFPQFIASARTMGADVASLIDPYLTSDAMQVIAVSDPDQFYKFIEVNPSLMQRFEKVQVQGTDEAGVVRVLEDAALYDEHREGVFFTYPALVTIAQSADRYFPSGVMPDKATDLLLELIPASKQKGKPLIDSKDVLDLIETKTGIPVGEVKDEEREKLLALETTLHERVVGQDEAVIGIANAMRRARTGVRNPDRPMGSFLFLGPTGVGKTETAKALADLFFGSEDSILRFDMSEYNGDDALDKMIGSFENDRPGTLATGLKEHPYGVLLLDEFEKTVTPVKDLFLQVLDEGVFSDKSGKKINARNVIIIATSNAGSEMIWEYFKTGADLAAHKDDFITFIIQKGLFKPELINRFDGVIIFHPLDDTSLARIAKLMLERLQRRMREKGIDLVVSDALVHYIVKYGADPKFGARPMNRAIQEDIEQAIADKMIRGQAPRGTRLELTDADLEAHIRNKKEVVRASEPAAPDAAAQSEQTGAAEVPPPLPPLQAPVAPQPPPAPAQAPPTQAPSAPAAPLMQAPTPLTNDSQLDG